MFLHPSPLFTLHLHLHLLMLRLPSHFTLHLHLQLTSPCTSSLSPPSPLSPLKLSFSKVTYLLQVSDCRPVILKDFEYSKKRASKFGFPHTELVQREAAIGLVPSFYLRGVVPRFGFYLLSRPLMNRGYTSVHGWSENVIERSHTSQQWQTCSREFLCVKPVFARCLCLLLAMWYDNPTQNSTKFKP
jgi:hypothetical protein